MELHENRTELERLLAEVWDYEDGGGRKAGLRKWLFAATLTGAVICTYSPSNVVAPVATALATAPEKLSVDRVSSENVAEDLDYRIARHSESPAGWRAFLQAHPDGPHAKAAQAEIDRLASAPAPGPGEATEQTPPSVAVTQTPVEAEPSPASPAPRLVMAENDPASPPPEPADAAEQSPPSGAATQAPVETEQSPASPAPPPATADKEAEPAAAAAKAPLPPSRPREIAVAKPVERAHYSHWRAGHREANPPNVFTVLIAQLFHGHRQRAETTANRWAALR